MREFLDRANALRDYTVAARRKIHSLGGLQFDIQPSCDFICGELDAMGIPYELVCPCGIVARVGSGEKTVLLRADYDALPIEEKDDLPYAAHNGTKHACGHDFHASMLLTAAKILKEMEEALPGQVMFMFQPAEEGGGGAQRMIDGGLFAKGKPDMAFGIHMAVGGEGDTTGHVLYARSISHFSGAGLAITVRGKGGHGARPFECHDPITTAAHILVGLQQIISYEIANDERVVVSFGAIHGGKAGNVITDAVTMQGTIRTINDQTRDFVCERIRAIATGIAEAFRCEAEVDIKIGAPAVRNNPEVGEALFPILSEIAGEGRVEMRDNTVSYGGDDFSLVLNEVPGIMIRLGAGSPAEGYAFTLHHPDVRFNEDALPVGVAINCNVAYEWLRQHSGK